MIKKTLYMISVATILVACSEIPKEAYFNRGDPASLLDSSSEVINLRINSPAGIQEMTNWINKDHPTRAELQCSNMDMVCEETENVLHQFGIPVKHVVNSNNSVALIYERIVARDCENRYIDNTINPYNLNHPTFGCSLAVNSVQMVSDKREFTNPATMGYADGVKSAQAIEFYNMPNAFAPATVNANFQDLATQNTLQTNGLSGGTR